MTIKLQHIVPYPLEGFDLSQSQIWDNDLVIEPGEWVLAQAGSGKGKSTILNIIYGNRNDYSGEAYINDKVLRQQQHLWWAKVRQQQLSMVFQDLRLFQELTGWENILLKLALTKHYDESIPLEMAKRLGIDNVLDKKAGHMSFGERQRTAIIRALMQPFEWLLLDEPFSHLDEDNVALAAVLITEECKKQNAGIIVAGLNDDNYFNYTRRIKL